MKRSAAFVLFLFFLLFLSACAGKGHVHSFGEWTTVKNATCTETGLAERTCSCGEKESEIIPVNADHAELQQKIDEFDKQTPYADAYALYRDAVAHRTECGCELDLTKLIQDMFFGKWVNDKGDFISLRYAYEDYNNTKGNSWYGNNLLTSQDPDRSYFYYTKVEGEKLIIGYQDRETAEKTDNYLITFRENGVTVWNNNDSTGYFLDRDPSFDGVQKGNARLAYNCLSKSLSSFDRPDTVEITGCYVDYGTKIVYAVIRYTDQSGRIRKHTYRLYEQNGQYTMEEYEHSYSSNVDLDELNQMVLYRYKYLLPAE